MVFQSGVRLIRYVKVFLIKLSCANHHHAKFSPIKLTFALAIPLCMQVYKWKNIICSYIYGYAKLQLMD